MELFKTIILLFAFLFSMNTMTAQQKSHSTNVTTETKMNYLLYEPPGSLEKAPLLVFLHGGGEGGNNIEAVKKHGLPMLVENGKVFPFYILSPQNPYEKGFWDDRAVAELIDKIVKEYPVDESRIYLAGLSRGGYGAWRLAMNNPGRFAAMLVICGASAPDNYAGWIKDIPVWVFHGEKDQTIPASESINMVKALKEQGAEVKLTLYPDAGHDSWTEAFNNDEVFEWLLSHQNK
ncbi:MAG TPA: prolyl oligopeptidase family serine peptidase [Prolixibacteraceae bacterium]|nr:prolyl oligopeptidase family serine peptidase [Prolixibacteraceae bacterium]